MLLHRRSRGGALTRASGLVLDVRLGATLAPYDLYSCAISSRRAAYGSCRSPISAAIADSVGLPVPKSPLCPVPMPAPLTAFAWPAANSPCAPSTAAQAATRATFLLLIPRGASAVSAAATTSSSTPAPTYAGTASRCGHCPTTTPLFGVDFTTTSFDGNPSTGTENTP